jgi:hypothetical protein
MGYGDYSHEAHVALTRARADAPHEDVFKQRSCHNLMNPKGVRFRESRDGADHPDSIGVVFALDVTGSMGVIPQRLAEEELPKFMKTLMDCGVKDPQLLFCAVGDATCDKAPLQVGQFESTAELMDQWLTRSYLEKGGGGQNTESYELAMYFFAQHTDMDCWRKRKKRGYFFMTGDELPYPLVSRHQVDSLIGDQLDADVPVAQVVAALEKTFEPFFLIPDLDRRARCERTWRDLLGDHVICMEDPHDTCFVAAGIVALREGAAKDLDDVARRVKSAGATADRVPPIVRALEAYAATLGRDGAPQPHVEGAGLPRGDGASGWKKT